MTKLAFTTDAKALRAVTAQGARTISKRGQVRALSCLHLDVTKTRLTVSSSDMELAGRTRMKLSGAKPGVALVPAVAFDKMVSTFDGDVTVEADAETRIVVSQGKTRMRLETIPAEDFPVIPQAHGKERTVAVFAPAFQRAYKFVKPHAGKDESRPVLTGVSLEVQDNRLFFAATDSYRLGVTWAEGAALEGALDYVDEDGKKPAQTSDVIVLARGLEEVSRLLKKDLDYVEIRRFAKHLSFQVGDTELVIRLIDGQFPNWRQLQPENMEDWTVVDRPAFVKALQRLTKIGVGRHAPLRATFFVDNETLPIRLVEQDFGEFEDAIPILTPSPPPKRGHTPVEIGWNLGFLLECLESFDTPDISIGTITALRPALIRNSREDEFTLIMPIRLAG